MGRLSSLIQLFLTGSALGLSLIACSPPAVPKAEESHSVRVKGDPFTVVRGTLMNQVQEVPASFFIDGASVNEISTIFKEGNAETNVGQVLDAQKAKTERVESQSGGVRIHKLVTGEWTIQGQDEGIPFSLDFSAIENDQVKFKKLKWDGVDATQSDHFELLHTSYNEKRGLLSFLFYFGRPGERILIAMYILLPVTDKAAKFPDGGVSEDQFFYSFGKGYKVGWLPSKPVDVQICGAKPEKLKQTAIDGIGEWQKELEGRLEITAKAVEICPPFSDVNSRTYNFVDEWLEIDSKTASNMGQTITSGRTTTHELVDGDVFILMSEVAKFAGGRSFEDGSLYEDPKIMEVFEFTALHELGHLLGLGHVEKGVKSIMSYDHIHTLQDYDTEAVQALYPLQTK